MVAKSTGILGGLCLGVAAFGAACGDGGEGGSGAGSGDTSGTGVPPVSPPEPPPCEPSGSGRLFEIGDGKAMADLESVPWSTLGPGDTVRIHHRAEPYRSKILLSTRGAEGAPIRVCGVPSASGALPVLSGENAKTSPNQRWISYMEVQDQGAIVVMADDDADYEFRPGYIVISGLEITGAKEENSYTASTGETRPYDDGASAIDVVAADHLSIIGNVLHDNGKGIFTLSKDEIEETVTRDVLIENNQIYGNGLVGSDNKHNTYTQAIGVTYQFNYFGPLRDGALGANLKDRSAGTVIRYNFVEGTQRMMDLVDAQEHTETAQADARYRETFVYGNVLVSRPGDGPVMIRYGGDTIGYEQNFRKGTLFLFHNTFVTDHDKNDEWTTTIVDAVTNDENVSMWNNVFWSQGTSTLRLLRHSGHAKVGVNWVTDGWLPGDELDFSGTVEGTDALIVGSDPGLDASFTPTAGSPAIDAAEASPIELGVDYEYGKDSGIQPRKMSGSAMDLGAREAN